METRIKPPLLITESDQFGLTENDVRLAFEEATNEVKEWKIMLDDPDKQLRTVAKRHLVHAEEQTRVLSTSPTEVLAKVRTFFDRAGELDHSGLDREQLFHQLGYEFPDIPKMYGLLRRQPWGYRLGQRLVTQQQTAKK